MYLLWKGMQKSSVFCDSALLRKCFLDTCCKQVHNPIHRLQLRKRRNTMQKACSLATVLASTLTFAAAALTFATAVFAQQGQTGTAQEARAMLEKAVAAVKADQAVALAMFIKGEGGFKDRDLYPFCFRIADGKDIDSQFAVPAGTDVRTIQ